MKAPTKNQNNLLLKRYNNLLDTYSQQKTRANILAQYTANEISNAHTENILLMFFHFGNVKDNLLARKLFIDRKKNGYSTSTPSRTKAEKLANKYYYKLLENDSSIKNKSSMKAPVKKQGVGSKKTPAKRKKAVAKRKTSSKKGLRVAIPLCTRTNPDGSNTSYSSQGGINPCPYGGKVRQTIISSGTLAGSKPKRKPTAKQLEARKKFAANVRAGKYLKK